MQALRHFFDDIRSNAVTGIEWTREQIDGLVADLHAVGTVTTVEDAQSLITYAVQMKTAAGVDDRKMRQEQLMSWLYSLPQNPKSEVGTKLERVVIQSLWDGLPHPSPTWAHYSGPQYHRADGSYNNVDAPHIGRSGERYIRDVITRSAETAKAQKLMRNGKGLPDPGEVFEKVYRRRTVEEGGFKPHPCGISANMFYWATLVTHDLFNTNANDRFRNKTTSYVDLSWLYGWNDEMEDSVRNKAEYRGKLHPDVFADPRMEVQPPGVVTMALLFCRNHNWLAEQLLIQSKYDPRFATIPKDDDIDGLKLLDEHLFQTAKNINCGTFVTAVLKDYVRMLLGINRVNTTWTLPINADFTSATETDIPKATGNQCSIEFNFIYRWHSAISQEDEKWIVKLFETLGPDGLKKELGEGEAVRIPAFSKWTRKEHEARATVSPSDRVYFALRPDIQRGPDGKFPDAALADIMKKGTDAPAGAFGGRQVPASLKDVEVMGILHGRQLGVCTLNELRKFCKLREYKTFKELNSDPTIASALEELYGDVANVELYPGLVAEEAKPKQAATGLCAGRTITYAILSDAVALVRGDRFHTTERNPYNLTQWGYDEVQWDDSQNFGNVLGNKLLNRHLGENLMPRDSIYTQFCFSTPKETEKNIKNFGMGGLYRETRK